MSIGRVNSYERQGPIAGYRSGMCLSRQAPEHPRVRQTKRVVRNHPRAPLLRVSLCIARLAVNMRHDSRPCLGQRFEHLGHQWPKHLNIVAWCVNDDDSNRKTGKVLLILQIAING